MVTELSTPGAAGMRDVVRELRDWQRDDAPIQLHPGDLGWHWRHGADATAAATRVWERDGRIAAIGLLDGPDVLRLTVAPGVWRDEDLARRIVADAGDAESGVLPAGAASVEAPDGTRVQELLSESGWAVGESWTPLRRDLAHPIEPLRIRIERVSPGHEADFTAVHRAAWDSARFTDELWGAMAGGPMFADAQCLLVRDEHGVAVAGITVWASGPGRPGLIEPLGVHPGHRGRGYGTAACVAAAQELQQRGASSAIVCTESVRTTAIATYRAAGFQRLPDRRDRTRGTLGPS